MLQLRRQTGRSGRRRPQEGVDLGGQLVAVVGDGPVDVGHRVAQLVGQPPVRREAQRCRVEVRGSVAQDHQAQVLLHEAAGGVEGVQCRIGHRRRWRPPRGSAPRRTPRRTAGVSSAANTSSWRSASSCALRSRSRSRSSSTSSQAPRSRVRVRHGQPRWAGRGRELVEPVGRAHRSRRIGVWRIPSSTNSGRRRVEAVAGVHGHEVRLGAEDHRPLRVGQDGVDQPGGEALAPLGGGRDHPPDAGPSAWLGQNPDAGRHLAVGGGQPEVGGPLVEVPTIGVQVRAGLLHHEHRRPQARAAGRGRPPRSPRQSPAAPPGRSRPAPYRAARPDRPSAVAPAA